MLVKLTINPCDIVTIFIAYTFDKQKSHLKLKMMTPSPKNLYIIFAEISHFLKN